MICEVSQCTLSYCNIIILDKVSLHKQLVGGVEIRPEIPKSPSGKILRRILRQEYKDSYKV